MAVQFANIDSSPAEVARILQGFREALRKGVPEPGESMSYRMPTITLDGLSLVHFAGWTHHIGLYPLPPADADLQRRLAPYDTGKGTARFRYDHPMPYDLVEQIARALVTRRMEDG